MGLKILLVDDHTLIRAGLRLLISSLPNIEKVLEASDGDEALKLLETEKPDVILTDIQMPKLNGLEILSRLEHSKSKVRVIILSTYANEGYILRALNNGAAGYVLKDAGPNELEVAIQAVMRGETYLDSRVSTKLADYMRRAGVSSSPLEQLTSRQREVLQLIAQGYSTKDTAKHLDLSVKTVETHRSQIMDILGIHDVPGLVRFAIRHGLIGVD